jgi:cytochrome c oxidase subunit 4
MNHERSTEHRAERRAPRLTGRSVLVSGLALLALWASSWALSYAHLGSWSFAVALTIAAVKAVIVALVFMELIDAPASSNAALVAAAVLIAVLFTLTLLDIHTRAREPMSPSELAHDIAAGR